jgi:hypothetical protein
MKPYRLPPVVLALLLGVVTFAGPVQAQGSASDTAALQREMVAVKNAVNELVALFRQFMDESGRRERSSLIIRRIDLAERQAAAIEDQLRAQRSQLDTNERAIAQARGQAESLRQFAALDKDGKNAQMLANEQARAAQEEQKAQIAVDSISARIQQLEAELAVKRAQIRDLEVQLDKISR